jgi:hypothetical protein
MAQPSQTFRVWASISSALIYFVAGISVGHALPPPLSWFFLPVDIVAGTFMFGGPIIGSVAFLLVLSVVAAAFYPVVPAIVKLLE